MLKLSYLKRITPLFFVLFMLSACGAAAPLVKEAAPRIDIAADTNYPIPANMAEFETAEYDSSNALGTVKAAYGYGNIQPLVDDDDSGMVTQGGEGQIVSTTSLTGFNTTHQEFTEDTTQGAAFDSIYDAAGDGMLYEEAADIIGAGNCSSACNGTGYAALIAGRKGSGDMHGIAYNVKIKAILTDNTEAQLRNAISEGVGANIIAMNNIFDDRTVIQPSNDGNPANFYYRPAGSNLISNIQSADNPANFYYLPEGKDHKKINQADIELSAGKDQIKGNADDADGIDGIAGNDDDSNSIVYDERLSDDMLNAWIEAVDPADDNNTIILFDTSNPEGNGNGFNSETGQVTLWGDESSRKRAAVTVIGTDIRGAINGNTVTGDTNGDGIRDAMDANIPSFHAGYPALYDDDGLEAANGLEAGRWLAVTAVDEDNVILETANGCGIAINYCLAAPGKDITTANDDGNLTDGYQTSSGTGYASATVAGALAVLKGAFPNATPEQLTQLVLDTATYIPLDDKNPDGSNFRRITRVATITEDQYYRTKIKLVDGTKRYINPVYGYGLLNLHGASTANVTASYVTASNNESIGVLWADTKLTLSSHFGDNFEPVTFGIGDVYGRHFVTNAPQTNYAPVAIGLDDYMENMLADNVQSQKLGGQAQANYSNSEQSWMDFEYKAGNATTKIAFQDSYKINPLSDTGTTTILRANNIRPASTNIGMMDVDYQLTQGLTLSSYLARGEYDTGYKFDELATDFDVNYKQSHLNIAIGNIREHGQFLGTNTSGAYALNAPSISRFTDVTYGHDLGGKFNLYANYINYETDVDMLYDQFASIDGLQADQYQIGFTGKDLLSDDDSLKVALITKLGVTDGALNQNSTLGYTADGAFNNASQSYDLAVNQRHQQFEITYQGKLYQNADKISALRDNRFFTSIRVDSNLNHVEGLGQVEVVSGINIRY